MCGTLGDNSLMASIAHVPAPRFGIGEWFGHPFERLTPEDRRFYANVAISYIPPQPCPFKAVDGSQACTKKGGVCSIRLFEPNGDTGGASISTDTEGDLRILCPHRFKQGDVMRRAVGEYILGTSTPLVVREVRFLRRKEDVVLADVEGEGNARPAGAREDVGNIDMVLVHPSDHKNWCALEMQAVYFSGGGMPSLFRHIRDFPTEELPFPDLARRPDYRSSGPKRLMPQLQIKVPTLRRWGKKMAVIVDRAWFRTNVVDVPTVSHVSNCDIAWFVLDWDESTDPVSIHFGEPEKQTLERAVEGLTGGYPVTLEEFEARIEEKLNS